MENGQIIQKNKYGKFLWASQISVVVLITKIIVVKDLRMHQTQVKFNQKRIIKKFVSFLWLPWFFLYFLFCLGYMNATQTCGWHRPQSCTIWLSRYFFTNEWRSATWNCQVVLLKRLACLTSAVFVYTAASFCVLICGLDATNTMLGRNLMAYVLRKFCHVFIFGSYIFFVGHKGEN